VRRSPRQERLLRRSAGAHSGHITIRSARRRQEALRSQPLVRRNVRELTQVIQTPELDPAYRPARPSSIALNCTDHDVQGNRYHAPTAEPCAKHVSRTYVGAGESLRDITEPLGDRSRPGVCAVALPVGSYRPPVPGPVAAEGRIPEVSHP